MKKQILYLFILFFFLHTDIIIIINKIIIIHKVFISLEKKVQHNHFNYYHYDLTAFN